MSLNLTVSANVSGVDVSNGTTGTLNVDFRETTGASGYLTVESTQAILSAAVAGACTVSVTQ